LKLSAKSTASLVGLGLIGAVVSSGVAYWRMRPEPLPAQVVYGSGRIEADEVRVAPEVAGRLLEMRAVEGETLRAGEPLARIDAADFELQADRGQAQQIAAQDGVVATPEIAYATAEALGRIVATTLDNIEAFARVEPGNLVVRPGMAGPEGGTVI